MKKQILLGALAFVLFASVSAQSVDTPVYLDDTKPVELRVEDALSRMTLEEKIAMIHAQSKFCSPGVSRLGIPEIWLIILAELVLVKPNIYPSGFNQFPKLVPFMCKVSPSGSIRQAPSICTNLFSSS
jgi:hypothetical protein